MTDNGSRASYLLDGRRVAVRDLLDAGLIQVGEQLIFARPRAGETYSAIVEGSGALVVGGRAHATPSAAARAATSARSDLRRSHEPSNSGFTRPTCDRGFGSV